MMDRLKTYGCILLAVVAPFSIIVIGVGFGYRPNQLTTPAVVLSILWGLAIVVGVFRLAREGFFKRDVARPTFSSPGKPLVGLRGGLGEPYCSQECYGQGGKYAGSAMLKNQAGYCGFCRSPVQASMYGEESCGVVPFEGVTLFVCVRCLDRARQHFSAYQKCSMCQKSI